MFSAKAVFPIPGAGRYQDQIRLVEAGEDGIQRTEARRDPHILAAVLPGELLEAVIGLDDDLVDLGEGPPVSRPLRMLKISCSAMSMMLLASPVPSRTVLRIFWEAATSERR